MFRRDRASLSKTYSQVPVVRQTSYKSGPVDIPDSFLSLDPRNTAPDRLPIAATRINFASTTLPEYANYYAMVLDNVLTQAECDELRALAEQSTGEGASGWKPALVNAGPGREFLATEYRNSDRIVWDSAVIVDRLFARCMSLPDVLTHMKSIKGSRALLGDRAVRDGRAYRLTRMNERMRFLKYGKGQFFRPHCDGSYANPKSERQERSFYTFQIYLNDSVQAVEQTPEAFAKALGNQADYDSVAPSELRDSSPLTPKSPPTLRGGATTFHSGDMRSRLDVDPKAGRVLIFQHAGLLHSGDEVQEGFKYAMRTDFMYELDDMPE